MASANLARFTTLVGAAALSVISCRSLLDITPGRPLEDAAGGSTDTGNTGGKSTSHAGSSGSRNDTGGVPQGGDGGTRPTNGGAVAGMSNGGAELGGQNGEGNAPSDPFPEGPCRDCIARDCPTEAEACAGDAPCTYSVASWLSCTEGDASKCVTALDEPLKSLETCGVTSCDLCRHLTDDAPSIEILTPSNGAQIQLGADGLIEVSVRVRNVNVKSLGQCGTDKTCGHIHLNLDGANCRTTLYYNQWIVAVAADGSADAVVNTKACKTPIVDRPLSLMASVSDWQMHADRSPPVQSSVTITVAQ